MIEDSRGTSSRALIKSVSTLHANGATIPPEKRSEEPAAPQTSQPTEQLFSFSCEQTDFDVE